MEIAIVAKAKQGYIYRYMLERGMSASALARELGTNPSMMGKIINFRWIPNSRRAEGRDLIRRIEEYFHIPIEILFPPELTREMSEKLSKRFVKIEELDLVALEGISTKYLSYDPLENADTEELLGKVMDHVSELTERQRTVIECLYGIGQDAKGYSAIGEEMNLSRERIRQIAAKAMRIIQWKVEKQERLEAKE